MLLAIDTATSYASLALHDGSRVRVEHTWDSPRRHTVELLPHLVTALGQLDLGAAQLRGVAVSKGPGSFTGLRVGLAVSKGLALARGLPLLGIPTLDVIASAQGKDDHPLCAVLQAGRSRICVANYSWEDGAWRTADGPRLTTWSALAKQTTSPTLFCGEIDPAGAQTLKRLRELAIVLPPAARLRRAGFLAELAWQRLNRGEADDPASLTPIYLQYPV
jgi:tRNA threonylcarbamoyladenosine biosynthesis protein TsaB